MPSRARPTTSTSTSSRHRIADRRVDIQNIVNVQGTTFDRRYVEHWLQHFVGDDPILEQFRDISSDDAR